MRWKRKLRLKFQSLLRRSEVEGDLSDELRDYVEREIDRGIAAGLSPEKSRGAAMRTMQGFEQLKEQCRDARGTRWIEDAITDLRFAIRAMRRSPAYTAMVLATLAVGIGANTAIFSVVDGILIRPLGYGDESRLVTLHEIVRPFATADKIPVNAMHFEEWRKNVHAFEQIAMIGGISVNLTGAGEPERLRGARASFSLFPMLRVQTQLGRTFLEEEDQAGKDNVVVLSNELWKRRFASDPGIIGRKIILDGHPYEVVGVLSPSFHFPKISQLYAMSIAAERPEFWKPFAVQPWERDTMGDFSYACIARLRPHISLTRALVELNAVQARIASKLPEKVDLSAAMIPLQDQITSRSRSALRLVLSAVGMLLLIGCVNIANLLLARSTVRERELSIRAAIGAGVSRLMRQMLTESLLLAGMGGAFGLVLAYTGLRLILAHAPADLPRLDEVHLNNGALLFTIVISVAARMFFGLLPAWRCARIDPQESMKSGAHGSTEQRGSARLRSLLVGLEVGLSTLCLMAGGLLLRSYIKLLETDKGFTVQHVITANLNLPDTRYDEPQRVRFMRLLLDSVRSQPGVESTGIANMLPLSGEGGNNVLTVEGTRVPISQRPIADIRGTNPEYFRTMGIQLLTGRIFENADREHRVAVISTLTAERLWPGKNPLGQRFKVGDPDGPFIEVAGVVGDIKSISLDKAPSMTVYLPYWQRRTWSGPSLAVRTAVEPTAVYSEIRKAIRGIDSELPVPKFQTMEEVVDESLAQRRFQMNLILLFAGGGLLLASLGIYGVVSYSVAVRINEMGIRIALGARRTDILMIVLRQGMIPVAVGLLSGVVVSLAAGRLLLTQLYGVAALDAVNLMGVALMLVTVAAIACLIPAQRTTSVDPATALRYE